MLLAAAVAEEVTMMEQYQIRVVFLVVLVVVVDKHFLVETLQVVLEMLEDIHHQKEIAVVLAILVTVPILKEAVVVPVVLEQLLQQDLV